MMLSDYGSEFPAIQELRGGYLIPVGIESYERTNPDESTTTCYRAHQVWVVAITELELDAAFGDLKAEYPDDYRAAALYPVRKRRDSLLAESDWTQALDAPVDQAAWSNYRQALRDITEQESPFSIVWPEVPASAQSYPNWIGFYQGLLVQPAFAHIRTAAAGSVDIAVAYADCAIALSQATLNRINVPAIQTSLNNLLALMTGDNALEQTEQDGLVELLASCSLEDTITLTFAV